MKRWSLYLCLVLAVLSFGGCSTVGAPRTWYAPATWFSHAPASSADAAHASERAADLEKQRLETEAVTKAHIEFQKAKEAAQSLPPSRPAELVNRFLGNGLGLLDQVQPLTAADNSALRKVVENLQSQNAEVVEKAEKLQSATEKKLDTLSENIVKADKRAEAAELKADSKDAELRKAFDRENALANTLRAQYARFWIVVALLVLTTIGCIYAKIAFGGIGAALHAAGAPAHVIDAMDRNVSGLTQWAVGAGRKAAAKLEAYQLAEAKINAERQVSAAMPSPTSS